MYGTVFSYQIIAAYVLSVHVTPLMFVLIYYRVAAVILLASFVLLIVAPELTNEVRYGGAWFGESQFRDVMSSKNLAGYVFASIFAITLNGSSLGLSLVNRAFFGSLAVLAVFLSNSATSLFIVIALTLLAVILRLAKPYRHILIYGALLMFLIAGFLIPLTGVGEPFGLLGRDSTFTGRTDLWRPAFLNKLPIGRFSASAISAFSPRTRFLRFGNIGTISSTF